MTSFFKTKGRSWRSWVCGWMFKPDGGAVSLLHGSCEPVWSQPGLPFPDQHGLSLCLPVSPCTDPEPQGPKPAPPPLQARAGRAWYPWREVLGHCTAPLGGARLGPPSPYALPFLNACATLLPFASRGWWAEAGPFAPRLAPGGARAAVVLGGASPPCCPSSGGTCSACVGAAGRCCSPGRCSIFPSFFKDFH